MLLTTSWGGEHRASRRPRRRQRLRLRQSAGPLRPLPASHRSAPSMRALSTSCRSLLLLRAPAAAGAALTRNAAALQTLARPSHRSASPSIRPQALRAVCSASGMANAGLWSVVRLSGPLIAGP